MVTQSVVNSTNSQSVAYSLSFHGNKEITNYEATNSDSKTPSQQSLSNLFLNVVDRCVKHESFYASSFSNYLRFSNKTDFVAFFMHIRVWIL